MWSLTLHACQHHHTPQLPLSHHHSPSSYGTPVSLHEVETLRGVVKTLASQVRYTQQKMKMDMEEMKLSMVEREEKVL